MAIEIYKLRTIQQYIDDIKQYLISKNSTFNNFNTGSRLLTLIESISTQLGTNSAEFFNGLKNAIPVAIYSAFDFTLKSGTGAVGTVEFYNNEPTLVALPIPAGTQIQVDGIVIQTLEDGLINAGNTSSGEISARATTAGVNTNIAILRIDTKNGKGTILNTPSGIEFARNNVSFAGGTDSETEEERIERFRNFINGLSRANLKGVLTGMQTIADLVSFSVVPNYPSAGIITIYAEDGAGTLSLAKKNEIEKVMLGDENDLEKYPGYVALGMSVNVIPPISVPTNFEFNIVVKDVSVLAENPSLVPDFLLSLKSTIEKYVNSAKIGEDVVISELITLIQNYDQEIFDVEVIEPAPPTAQILASPSQVVRTGAGTGAAVTLTLSSTMVY
jgi:hypothetical protein